MKIKTLFKKMLNLTNLKINPWYKTKLEVNSTYYYEMIDKIPSCKQDLDKNRSPFVKDYNALSMIWYSIISMIVFSLSNKYLIDTWNQHNIFMMDWIIVLVATILLQLVLWKTHKLRFKAVKFHLLLIFSIILLSMVFSFLANYILEFFPGDFRHNFWIYIPVTLAKTLLTFFVSLKAFKSIQEKSYIALRDKEKAAMLVLKSFVLKDKIRTSQKMMNKASKDIINEISKQTKIDLSSVNNDIDNPNKDLSEKNIRKIITSKINKKTDHKKIEFLLNSLEQNMKIGSSINSDNNDEKLYLKYKVYIDTLTR